MTQQTTPEPTRLEELVKVEGVLIDCIRTGELQPDRTWRIALAGIQKRIEQELDARHERRCREALANGR